MLSNAELLAIIIKTGTKDKNAVQIAQSLLTNELYKNRGFNFLHNVSIEELMKYKGIGKVKAIQLKAISEIIKRASVPTLENNIKIKCPMDMAQIIMSTMRFESREKIKVALIDFKGNLKNIVKIQEGNVNSVNIEPKDIFKEAIKKDIPRIIILHNHPSGDPTPSREDIDFTVSMRDFGSKLGIEVLDHIIIGDGIYKSIFQYMEENNIF